MNSMNHRFDTVLDLAGDDAPTDFLPSQEQLETYLTPLVRRVARTGKGQPALVDWVFEELLSGEWELPPDGDFAALAYPMARKLGGQILARHALHIGRDFARETVLGA